MLRRVLYISDWRERGDTCMPAVHGLVAPPAGTVQYEKDTRDLERNKEPVCKLIPNRSRAGSIFKLPRCVLFIAGISTHHKG